MNSRITAIRERFDEELEQTVARVKANNSYQQLERRYLGLSDRDRRLVNWLALALALFIAWRLVFGPALGYLDSASNQYQKQLANYGWMQEEVPKTKALLDAGATVREGSLLSVASATAKNHELSFSRFEPIGDDRVRLWLEQVVFNNVVSWLGELEEQHGVSAIDISLDSAAPGYVSVRLTLQG
ncbi:MAG: type II secretion system protein M [Gammaproteobacteria bacterium]|nr:type II secretion system protein M [Gammaproteobacteria bacterium]MBT8151636.1 type II secretion system protein M [Gammaproteobacteria bacterium]NND39927.1 type II secretion system protein M [Pseudomonadales bacterium]NNM10672.1 type II secretion system protein M [Pseudomonadales bacterium]RZV56184.1 MAG: type II secretion system protein M [Pseudomonadales bacterium]